MALGERVQLALEESGNTVAIDGWRHPGMMRDSPRPDQWLTDDLAGDRSCVGSIPTGIIPSQQRRR
jgi:hypothetical protein